MTETPSLISGGVAVDDRGKLQFCNEFDMAGIRRFYVVSNHAPRFIRAWHAHKNEAKYVTVVSGAALVCAVAIDDWEAPSKDSHVWRFVLSEEKGGVVYVPPGHANGAMSLLPDTKIVYFSSASMNECHGDDFRFPYDYWDPWNVVPR